MKEYPCQQLLGGTGAAIYSNEGGLCDHPECRPQLDDHTLNACLARVIGQVIVWNASCGWWGFPLNPQEIWDPLHNPAQMEEVEAWVTAQGVEIWSHYDQHRKRWFYAIGKFEDSIHKNMDGGKLWVDDPDKKRAFALAVQAMEQSNNNNNKED